MSSAPEHGDAPPPPGYLSGYPSGEPGLLEHRWHYRRSLASRVTLLTTIAVGLSVAFLSAGVFVTARMQLHSQGDQTLLQYSRNLALADAEARANLNTSVAVLGSGVQVAYISATGAQQVPKGQDTLPLGDAEVRVARGEVRKSIRTIVIDGREFRVCAVPASEAGFAVVYAQPLDQQKQLLARLGAVSLVFGLLGVLGAGIAGWGVARNGLRPVRRLTRSVETIAETEDLTPLPVEGDDEIARLATAFNQMLTALDASRERQRRLVTDAGHELRTPLTSLRTNVDLLTQAAQDERTLDPQARDELLDDIRAQIDELTTLIGDLTELARDEPLAPIVGEVDLSEIVDLAVARVRRRAVDATLVVETEGWDVVGEAGALERAVTNLLDNAVKWSPPGGVVTVRLADGVLTVDDEGPGIAEADRQKVFDRFWRAEESRTMPGSGLGLSIVRQVAERHSGSARAEASPAGGARVVLTLPGRLRENA